MESATCAAWAARGQATVRVHMHDEKDGSVGVGWDGCTQ